MIYADTPFEMKTIGDAGAIEGIAAGFGDVDNGGDKLLFGAMTKTLAERGSVALPMLLHHDAKRPIGAWTEWRERPDGLHVKGQILLASRDGAEAHALAKMGALSGISIGYAGARAARHERGVRVLPEVKLFEASLVTVPMHDRARVTSIKSISTAGDIADLLRESGLSGRQAKAAAGAAWKVINDQSDEEAADAELASILNTAAARIAAIGR